MTDIGFVSTVGATVGQTLTFSWSAITGGATLRQQSEGDSAVIIINNLSPCTFRVTLDASQRSFTLPAGVPTNPIPTDFGGTSDQSVSLLVDNVAASATPNQVHFDWFGVGQPILYVASASGGILGVPDRILDPTDQIGIQVVDNPNQNFVQLTPTTLNRGIILQAIDALGAVRNLFAIEAVGNKVDIFPAAGTPSTNFLFIQSNASFYAHADVSHAPNPTLGALQTGIASQTFNFGSDMAGQVHIKTSGAPPPQFTNVFVLNFANAYANTNLSVQLTLFNSPEGAFYTSGVNVAFINVACGLALAANTDYVLNYFIVSS